MHAVVLDSESAKIVPYNMRSTTTLLLLVLLVGALAADLPTPEEIAKMRVKQIKIMLKYAHPMRSTWDHVRDTHA